MKAKITISLKNGVLDPEGKAIEGALKGLGFDRAGNVRRSKIIELEVDEADETAARETTPRRAKGANPVMESYEIEILA